MYWFSRCTSRSFSSIISSSARSVASETPLVRASVEQRRGAFDVERLLAGQLLERRLRQPQRARQQLVVERSLLLQPREHGLAHVEQRQAGELGVQVVCRLHQIVRPQRLRRRRRPSA